MKAKITPILIPAAFPVVGNKYHTSWSNNPWVTWTLTRIMSNNKCVLSSKLSSFETETSSLRISALTKKHPIHKVKQLVLIFEKTLQYENSYSSTATML